MNKYFGNDDLVMNTASRLPVCLCLDTSGSMAKNDAIQMLNKGVEHFYEAIKSNEQAVLSCEIAVVTFASEVTVAEEYSSVDTKATPSFKADGGTAMAHGVNKALDMLEERKLEYKRNGVDYYQPWLVLITDGKPGDLDALPAAQERTRRLIADKKLVIFPIVVGNDDNEEKYHSIMQVVNGFCLENGRKSIHLKDLKFEEFFEWLGKSVSAVSMSQVGEKVKLDISTMDEWGEI